LAISDHSKFPSARDADELVALSTKPARLLDPHILHKLASEEYTVSIEFWKFKPATDDPLAPLVATPYTYEYPPFMMTVGHPILDLDAH
jgi:hypothetical protein